VLSKAGFPFDLFWSQSLPPGKHSPELLSALQRAGILNASATPNKDGTIPLNNVPPGTYASRLYGNADQISSRVLEELNHIVSNVRGNITILLMHRDDEDFLQFSAIRRAQTPIPTIMRALSDSCIANHVWGFGWSNWKTLRVEESLAVANSLEFPLLFNSPYFSLFEMNATRSIHVGGVQVRHADMQSPRFQQGILFNPYSPLGGWSIFDQKGPDVWEQSWKNALAHANDNYWMNVQYAIFTAANALRFQTLQKFTQMRNARNGMHSFAPRDRRGLFIPDNYTMDQFANAYALAHNRTDFLTIGPISVSELTRSVEALWLSKELTKTDLDYLCGESC
jgi:aryl-alcohol dehydrogenase-like predicted oxidoreductase